MTQGKVAFVDDDDFDFLNQWKWYAHKNNNTFYADHAFTVGCRKQKIKRMHHIIMGDPPMGLMIDHVDGNGLNNCRENLRFVTRRQNAQNSHRMFKTSKYPGVSFVKRENKWRSLVWINGIRKELGSFPTEEMAYGAYCAEINKNGEELL